jgi:hypothetical protein
MKKTRSKKSRDTVPLNGISTDQLGNRVVVRGGSVTPPSQPLYAAEPVFVNV